MRRDQESLNQWLPKTPIDTNDNRGMPYARKEEVAQEKSGSAATPTEVLKGRGLRPSISHNVKMGYFKGAVESWG